MTRTVSFQGTALSASQRRSLQLRQQVQASMKAAPSILQELDEIDRTIDWEARRYWNLVADFNRYGQLEYRQKGTPWVGDTFGH